MDLAVVIPAYRSAHLHRVLESLAGIEADVVVVDSSPDGPPVVGPDARTVSLPERTPPGVARNVGAQESSGEWLLFLDSDVELDAASRSFVASQVKAAEVDVVSGVYRVDPATNGPIEAIQNAIIRYRLLRRSRRGHQFGSTSHMLVRRSAFERAGGFDPDLVTYEDYEFSARCFRKGITMTVRPDFEAVHLKRYTAASLLRDYREKVFAAFMARKRHAATFDGFDMNLGWAIGATWVASFLFPPALLAASCGVVGGVEVWCGIIALALAPVTLWGSALAPVPASGRITSIFLWPLVAWNIAAATIAAAATWSWRQLLS